MTNIQAANLLKGLEQSLDDYCELNDEGKTAFRMAITALELFGISEQLPSAQPDLDEWCTDCKEYDSEKNCCPRWNRVIREALKDGWIERKKGRWIPCSERLPDEKDAGILKKLGIKKQSEYVFATVEVKGERMTVTVCTYDGKWDWNMKYAFPDYKVIAWMPFPEPYREESEKDV